MRAPIYFNSSHVSGVPRATAPRTRRPSTCSRCLGGRPRPGRIARRFSARQHVPGCRSVTTYSERRNCSDFFSASVGAVGDAAEACQARSVSTTQLLHLRRLQREGGVDAAVGAARVKCFSITVAPRATLATATPMPIVWSDRPDLAAEELAQVRDGARVRVRRRRRVGAGALEQHQIRQPASRAARTASSSSATVAMPVEMISGLPVAATLRMSGRWAFSKDAIL